MPLFKKRPLSADLLIVRDRCWDDPALDALVDTTGDQSRPADARVAGVLSYLAPLRDDPERQVQAMNAGAGQLADVPDAVRDAARAAAAQSEGDRRGAADAIALRATTLVQRAWEVRGAGRASTVTEDSFQTFHEILEEADTVGRDALDLDPSNPGAATARLTSGRGLGLPNDEWWHRFDVGRLARPTLYPVHHHMLQALCKKWYGSHELMLDFARKVAREAPVGDPVGAMLAEAHAEYLVEESSALVSPEDQELLAYASQQWVSGGEAALRHPQALAAHQLFGWAFRKSHPELRYFHLSRVGGRLSSLPWNYLKDGEKAYRELLDKGTK